MEKDVVRFVYMCTLYVRRNEMTTYLTNAFSLNMIGGNGTAKIEEISSLEAVSSLGFSYVNAIGHADTDAVVRKVLFDGEGREGQRLSVALVPGDVVIVAQYSGPRLPEGCKILPDGATIKFYKVSWK
jgi:hypothetical protein